LWKGDYARGLDEGAAEAGGRRAKRFDDGQDTRHLGAADSSLLEEKRKGIVVWRNFMDVGAVINEYGTGAAHERRCGQDGKRDPVDLHTLRPDLLASSGASSFRS
jgi:hypothetical protein